MKRRLFALLTITFLSAILRFPSFFEPYWHGDEGITLAVSQELRRGETLYQEISDNKPPLLYLIATKTSNLFSLRLLTTIWVLGGIIGFWFLSRKLILNPYPAIFISVPLLSLPLLEANVSNGEIWFVPLTILGMLLTTSALTQSSSPKIFYVLKLILAGLAFSLAVLFKVPAVMDWLAAAVFILTSLPVKRGLKSVFFLTLGVSLPGLLLGPWLIQQGNLGAFINEALINNFIYTGTWGNDPLFSHSRLVLKITLLGVAVWSVWKRRRAYSLPFRLSLLWFSFTLIGALISNRPYRHYLLPLVPPFSLTTVLITRYAFRRKKIFHVLLVGLYLITLSLLKQVFDLSSKDLDNQILYYRQFWSYLNTRKEITYLSSFDSLVPDLYRTSSVITNLTSSNDDLFVWGNGWLVYSLAERPLATKYPADYSTYHLPKGQKLAIIDLERRPPAIIVLSTPQRYPLPGLAKIIAKEYYRLAQIGNQNIYGKI
jgi:hypothetical protein